MTNYLLTASNMPDCNATAAFAKVAYNMQVILVEHTHKFNTLDDLTAAMSSKDITSATASSGLKSGVNNLYIIGSFWKNSVDLFLTLFDSIGIYTFGETVVNEKITVFSDVDKLGSITWLRSIMPQSMLVDAFAASKQHIISKANVRCFGEGPDDVQQLFTGIYDYSATNKITLFNVFVSLFVTDNALYDSIMERGKILLSNHKGIGEERARRNTKIFTTERGAKVALTEGTELINFTHEGLVKSNADVDITVVIRHKFDRTGPNDEMSYSIRSYSEKFNAAEIVQHVKGSGGSDKAAGCSVPAPIDFTKVL